MQDRPALQIRRYEAGDHDAVWSLHKRALQAIDMDEPSDEWAKDLHDVEHEYFDKGGEFLVGLVDGVVVAMGALKPSEAGRAEVTRMRIDPGHQRRGYGASILNALEDRARTMAIDVLFLETTVQQVAAQGLYERYGYKAVSGRKVRGFDTIIYEKALR